MHPLQTLIEQYYESRQSIQTNDAPLELRHAVNDILDQLDAGTLRVAEPKDGDWQVNQWVKKAVLLAFKLYPNEVINSGYCQYIDKIPLKWANASSEAMHAMEARVVPHAIVRRGAYVGKNTILMPSFTNIGAYIGEGTMVDTWATVGSCAQIGKHVHLSGGVGIGGVLEPLQANPTIIEDHCFIGARSEIVEGVIVEHHAVISMGVFIGKSTKIYNRLTNEITYGRIPAGAVVVSGSLPSDDQRYNLYCAVIVKQVDEKTREKVGINELLRGIE